jgi:DNA-binding transcriptional LysR family regulator
MKLSGRLIDAFLALEETRHFGLAAQRCNVSPSALSQSISRLEVQLGIKLFDRNTRNVSLTPEGEIFSQGANRIAAEMSSALNDIEDRLQKKAGRVSLAAPPSIASNWLPERMALFKLRFPNIELRLFDVVSDQCIEFIRQGQADIAINAQPGNLLELDSKILFNEPMFLICHSSHPFAGEECIALKDLKKQPFIHTTRTGSVWQHVQTFLGIAGVVDTGLEVTQLGTLGGLVARDFGLSIVPQFALTLCMQRDVAAVRIKDKRAVRPIYLMKKKNHSLSVAAQCFYDQLLLEAVDQKTPSQKKDC